MPEADADSEVAAIAAAAGDNDNAAEREGPPSRMEHPAATLVKDPFGDDAWPLIVLALHNIIIRDRESSGLVGYFAGSGV